MTHNHKIDIRAGLCAIAAALTLLTFPAAAQSLSPAQARQWCYGNGKVSDDQRLDGCSALLKANPSNAVALANRGESYRRKGDPERAVADLNRAVDLDPKDASAWYNRGIPMTISAIATTPSPTTAARSGSSPTTRSPTTTAATP